MFFQRLLSAPLFFLPFLATSQNTSGVALPEKYLPAVEKRVGALTQKLDQKTDRYLTAFQKREERLLQKLAKKDRTQAVQLLAASTQQYQQLEQRLNQEKALQEYIPALDTMVSSLKFLSQNGELLSKTKAVQGELTKTLEKVDGLQSSLGKAEAVQQFLKERKEQLATQLKDLPFAKDINKLYKQAYYYQAQVEEYKTLLKDKSKWERKALELLSKTKAFQNFMRKHSQLAALFRIPGGEEEPPVSLAGLQTRAQVSADLQQRFGSDPAAIAQLRENVQAAQGQLNQLKNKAERLQSGSIGNSNGDIQQPQFRPNQQRTKSFRSRLELGANVQTQKARWLFPITSDIGLSLGYRLNDKSSIGAGLSYKIGLGHGWQHIHLTHQGVGLRSYVEYQLKGSFFISGGYEQNYRSEIKAIEQLKDRSAWQQSGLLGLTKKYKADKKLKGSMQLLWDFLSYQQIPRTQAVCFRVGYSLK